MIMRKNPEKIIHDILETSLRLFQEVGYDKTSILDIVDAMGVSRGAFYHHFKSKEEILRVLMENHPVIKHSDEFIIKKID